MTVTPGYNYNNSKNLLNNMLTGIEAGTNDPALKTAFEQMFGEVKAAMADNRTALTVADQKEIQEILKISAKFQQLIAPGKPARIGWAPYLSSFIWTPPKPDFSSKKFDVNQVRLLTGSLFSIIEKNLSEEGLYRLGGSTPKINELVNSLKENVHALIQEPLITNMTGVIKALFREMGTRLLEPEFTLFREAATTDDVEQKKQLVHRAIDALPPENKMLLHSLLNHLRVIASQSAVNKMTSTNLATCFAANIFPPNENIELTLQLNALLAFLITHREF
jgi:hypothetical protein